MRLLVLSVGVLGIACLGATCATCAVAQNGQWGQAQDQIPPYRTHVDRRHGNDHIYPDRGAVLRDLPRGAIGVNYAGISYRFAAGVWYEPLGPAYLVVAPPIGLIVPNLPPFATSFDSAGKAYLYANDVFYRPRPELGGYEVVNDPQDAERERSRAAAGASAPRLAAAAPSAPPLAAAQSHSQTETPAAPPAPPAAAPSSDSPAPANPTGVAIQPRHDQSADQQAMDRYECYRFAVAQTGFDPLAANSGAAAEDVTRSDAAYSRAQAACLESRGYSVP